MPLLMRALMALALCPTLGAMLGRYYAGQLATAAGGELWGWTAGAAGGLLYAIALIRLCRQPLGTGARAAGDLVLVALSLLAMVDFASQLLRIDHPALIHITGGTYLLGLLIVLMSSGTAADR